MDIHISNLDPRTTIKALRRHLKDKFLAYGIHSFECSKPKDKTFAFVTVADVRCAEQFLAAHQTPGRLYLTRPLTVKRGRQAADPYTVDALRRRQHDVITKLPSSNKTVRIQTIATSCGLCTYNGDQLVYRPEWEGSGGMMVLGNRALTLVTPMYDPQSTQQSTLLRIDYSTVELMITDRRGHGPSLTMILNTPPKAYHLPKASGDILDILSKLALNANRSQPMRVRGADLTHERISSQCLVYRTEFLSSDSAVVDSFLHHKSSYVPSTMNWSLRKVASGRPFCLERDDCLNTLAATNLTFGVKFQIQALLNNAVLLPSAIQALVPVVAELLERASEAQVAQALIRFQRKVPFAMPDTAAKDLRVDALKEYLEAALMHVEENPPIQLSLSKKYEHLFLVHRALVTPTGIYFTGPDLEPVNRVLREYADFASTHFLRVSFEDEDAEPIRYDRNSSLEQIHNVWFRRVLTQGVYIAGRTFSFLGFSNSSLREQSCWLMAPFKHKGKHFDAWTVVRGLGDFSEIHAPAKCAARIGQAFSDTPGGAIDLLGTEIIEIRDVERNGYTFSDGCGTISPALLRKVWSQYKRNCRPSLFQIRWAGAKGMVSLDSRLEGQKLCFRPSMRKFMSKHNNLEICNAARRPLPFYLNRQLVKILEDLGVPEQSFHDLQDRAIAELRAATSSPIEAAAFLDRKDIGRGHNLPWLMEKLHEIDIDARNDKFLRWALEHAILAELRVMKHKARIPVEGSFTLYGIMDETGILLENQIFCRVDGKVVTGFTAITRSPALHPGDVQHALAVSVSRDSPLMSLDNCVVFSQHGERDLPSQLSGGDLDGDIFNVILDRAIIPPKRYKPAAYKRPVPVDLYREMEREDIIDWFIKFMQNDQLARIATLHVQLADRHVDGTLNPDCLTLAELHSTAVDFQKTGIAVEMSRVPRYKGYRPHFMAPDPRLLRDMDHAVGFEEDEYIISDDDEGPEAAVNPDGGRFKTRTLYYHSKKILGQLYDKIDERSFLREIDSMLPTTTDFRAMDKLWTYIKQRAMGLQWSHMEHFAWNTREEYEELLVDLMSAHGCSPREPLTEIEVFMGSIVGKAGALPSRRVTEAAKTMKERFNEGVQYITRRIVHGNIDTMSAVEFATDANWADTSTARDQALERSMACLEISLQPGTQWPGLGRHPKRLQSFQYVAGTIAMRELMIFEKRNGVRLHGLPILAL